MKAKPSTSRTQRPAGFSRRASAIFGAALATLGAAQIESTWQFAPGAFEQRQELIAKAQAQRERGERELLSFREFVQIVHPRYKFYKHCEVLGDVLQRVADGKITRLMIFMPPRHGKSEETSRLFSAYFLYRYPERKVGLCSYSAGLAYTLSRAAKDFFVAGGGQLRHDAKAVKEWWTPQGGQFWAAGVGGEATGKGWHLGIIDDPLKNAEQATSPKIREKQKEWFQSVFSTREEPDGGALVFILTRWNEDDLAGWQLAQEAGKEEDEKERWHIVNFPAICEESDSADAVKFPDSCTIEADWRKPGEALCPERYNASKLKKIAAQVGAYFWNALFQQRPRPREGGIFGSAVKFVGAVPVGCKFVRYWDKAGSEGKGDYTAGVLMARCPEGRFFVVDVVRGQWAAAEREATMRATAELDVQRISAYGQDHEACYSIWIEQEGGSGGKDSGRASVQNLEGFSVFVETVSGRGKKELRADPLAAQWQIGNVFIVRGLWNVAYINEMTGFPNMKNDDQVDGSSGAFNHLALGARWEWD